MRFGIVAIRILAVVVICMLSQNIQPHESVSVTFYEDEYEAIGKVLLTTKVPEEASIPMHRLPKVQTRVVRLLVMLVLLTLALSLGACGLSRQQQNEAPADTAERPANEGEFSMNVPGPAAGEAAEDNIFDAKAVKVGDKVLGMEIVDIYQSMTLTKRIVRAGFSGQATVSGTYTHEKQDEEMLRCQIRFKVDEESSSSLPKEKTDTRILWFVFKNQDEAEELLGPPGSSGEATIVIDEYRINLVPSCEYNTAKLVRVIEKQ